MADALDGVDQPAGAAGDPLAGLDIDDEEFEEAGDVGAFPVAVHVGFGDADGAAGKGAAGQAPVVAGPLRRPDPGALPPTRTARPSGMRHLQRAARQVHGRRQHHARSTGEATCDLPEIFSRQAHRLSIRGPLGAPRLFPHLHPLPAAAVPQPRYPPELKTDLPAPSEEASDRPSELQMQFSTSCRGIFKRHVASGLVGEASGALSSGSGRSSEPRQGRSFRRAPDPVEGRERAPARRLVIDERQGIGGFEVQARIGKRLAGCRPRLMDPFVAQPGKFWDEAPYILATGVEPLTLQDGIEDAEVGRGVGAGAGDPLPVRRIVRRIGVDQRIPEPGFAGAPIDQEMLDQERGDDHADAVVHAAGAPELAHAGVDDRIAGAALLPAPEIGCALPPGELVEAGVDIVGGKVRMAAHQVIGELAPRQLLTEGVDAAPAPSFQGGEQLGWRDLAMSKMRRQPGRAEGCGPFSPPPHNR